MKKAALLTVLASLMIATPALADGDATKGAVIYKSKCGMCHMPDKNMVGPKKLFFNIQEAKLMFFYQFKVCFYQANKLNG